MSLRPVATEDPAFASTAPTEVEIDEVVPAQPHRARAVRCRSAPPARLVGAVLLARAGDPRRRRVGGRIGRGDVADSFLVRHADRILPVAVVQPRARPSSTCPTPSPCTGSPSGSTPSSCTTPAADEDVFAVRDARRDLPLRRPRGVGPPARQAAGPAPPPSAAGHDDARWPRVAPTCRTGGALGPRRLTPRRRAAGRQLGLRDHRRLRRRGRLPPLRPRGGAQPDPAGAVRPDLGVDRAGAVRRVTRRAAYVWSTSAGK